MTELPFLLTKGEKLLKSSEEVTYIGNKQAIQGLGLGTSFGSSGIGTYQGNMVDMPDTKKTNAYLTNKRIVFVSAKKGFFSGEVKIGSVVAEIELKDIKSINSGEGLIKSFKNIKLGVKVSEKIQEIAMAFNNNRTKERDEWINLIKKNV
jgi:hypothetical protein